ncbi:DinB family protein [Caenibacillus caldisaponilyticus]|uniref:DinB family protein n=1 Tax=Caenibacillus caldisaponilyticus TaxID=1674942 RepID=UPI0009882EFF|nr:DinB family protein [Caenibacillus caldisaponilyticus]
MGKSRLSVFQSLRDYSWDAESWFLPMASAIEGVTSEEASWRPPGGGNTIWQTLNPLNYYNACILERLKGRSPDPSFITNTATFGAPGDPDDREGWKRDAAPATSLSASKKR